MTQLKSLSVENFVAFQNKLEWKDHASLNVIIGENDTGKTHLLKLLYATLKGMGIRPWLSTRKTRSPTPC